MNQSETLRVFRCNYRSPLTVANPHLRGLATILYIPFSLRYTFLMSFRTFFRPTAPSVSTAISITLIAAVGLYITLNCALNGSYGCQSPVWVQLFLIGILWPLVAVVRFLGGSIGTGLSSLIGIVLSGFWVYTLFCVGRGILSIVHKKRTK